MTGPSDFDELVGDDIEPSERARLLRVHELLVAAGPPAELPAESEPRPRPAETLYPMFPRRRLAAAAALAAALALAAFGVGFLVGDRAAEEAAPELVVAMSAPGGATAARASLAIFGQDDAGNWPMELTVRNLEAAAEGGRYELWLMKDGELAELCGAFVIQGTKTVVPMNAPYRLKEFDEWVVVRRGSQKPVLTT